MTRQGLTGKNFQRIEPCGWKLIFTGTVCNLPRNHAETLSHNSPPARRLDDVMCCFHGAILHERKVIAT